MSKISLMPGTLAGVLAISLPGTGCAVDSGALANRRCLPEQMMGPSEWAGQAGQTVTTDPAWIGLVNEQK
ncbi:hypothetical protein WJX72_011569 [[Myrmecia] bisecta]|uniref:Uncharacterized protein n=1 Tax=[Myrmecia] bisecta TaxID=41462 RepID=A0AAW1Q4X4_9CHLO